MADVEKGIDYIADKIRELGYRSLVRGDDIIESSASGLKFSVLYSPGLSVQFHCGIVLADPSHFSLEHVNGFNAKYRFAKLYLDDDNDLCCEADFPIDLNRDSFSAELQNILGLWEGSMSLMKESTAEARRAAREDGDAEHVAA